MPSSRPSRRRLVLPAGPELSRRRMLGGMGALAGVGLLGPTLLAACGDDDSSGGGGGGGGGGGDTNALRFDNWPAYIDEETVALFTEASGLDFTYNENFNDNNEYFARVQSDLAAGRDIGTDIIAPTYWMAGRLISLGWVQELDLDAIPNASNLVESLRNPSWDPDGTFSLPWQAGMTGIAYNAEAAGRDLTSLEDLFDPAFSGKIGMLTEMRDTVGLMMLLEGEDPAEATIESAEAAFERIRTAKEDGTVRQFTGNDYMDDLASGNFIACIGWSGDIAQLALEDPNLKFVIPDEGGMSWTDTMVVPNGAENAGNVATWMDYVYDPENAARITEYVGYNSPVEGVRDILAAGTDDQKALAESTLLFPDEETLGRLHSFANLDEDAEAEFDERFSEIIGV
ncbi:spermidine/putrescine ABC transporter substrate-binding protein [Iamia sp. SCSIO 61187]|uniref:ABC transporter substrate-binding protein n=1 Tax=Iamia sp. SCSIO 61187 TaxID=2722752 RepID=UPI001C62E50F|nr:spermidine/putrescine ABC transporter substrate-binding protein [Iamia sp. SCSIO 61187]QYG94511.1 spermidine/putrescine ABC transporter substrate-binding protein [Iamia sp. SCSIO 61187]